MSDDILKLENYDSEDISDIIIKLEKSLGLKFEKDAFYYVKTLGDLCDVFQTKINSQNQDDCTSQQAFYRVRNAIVATQQISPNEITPDTRLFDIFPRNDRRKRVKEFKSLLGAEVKMLTYPDWLALMFGLGILLSLIAFFFDWKIGVSGIVLFVIATKIANKLGKDLTAETVRELCEKLSREHYAEIRRNKNTFNRNEINEIIIDTFSKELGIDKGYLTRDEKFD